ncbi:MAG: HsdR family type I site-specific deoxyribonuclease [Bacteroidetes bacterium]|jgi:type I restriction enzyme R subunit|nr:HsdR family type I site-specific deoxyribonuclease [Bacteroidota bacterium]
MSTTRTYAEVPDVQQPALRLLELLGYEYLTAEEVKKAREGSTSEVLLRSVLDRQLRRINEIEYKGRTYDFSDGNIHEAIEALRTPPLGGLVHTNEYVYDLLTLGKSFEQEIEGDRKSHPLRYIDWDRPERNVYHVVPEFYVEGRERPKKLDLVLFVNGIPLVVIECKRRDKKDPVAAGIGQLLTYQKPEYIRPLFYYAQLLLSAQPNEVRYGTVGTEEEFWSRWREAEAEDAVSVLLTRAGENRLPTKQDRVLWALCRPERLLELTFGFVVFDAGIKKIARYQQYFAVKAVMERVRSWDERGRRKGGVIYHTQGSGKSITMVFLTKALALADDIRNPRVIVVTDRKDLDRQITNTLRHCGKEPVHARSGAQLAELIEDDRVEVVTTVINKFKTAVERERARSDYENLFCLVDEGHRTQYGTLHALMRKALPKACYIGFTGTPLMKEEKNTLRKFGGFIGQPYTMDQAVEDEAVVPLLYEQREARQYVYGKPLDRAFGRVAEHLTDEQTADLKRKATTKTRLQQTRPTVEEVVYDVIAHYTENWQGTGFKAQLAVPSKSTAVRAWKIFERDGRIKAAVVISPPDQREDLDDEDPKQEVIDFWRDQVEERFSSDGEAYEQHVIERFQAYHEDDPGIEILIVVSKLLTGFDAPRNTILYVYKNLREHTLLQAVARVNRLFPGKDFGYIVDYWGILEELDKALTTYTALSGFDQEELARDLGDALVSVRREVDKLGQYHTDLLRIFEEVDNKNDIEALERHLQDKERRDDFYERLARFSKTLQLALSSQYFHDDEVFPPEVRRRYMEDAKFFQALRRSVRERYGEAVDFKQYERRVDKLLHRHVAVDEVEQVVPRVNIFDREALAAQIDDRSPQSAMASKADAIAHRTKKQLTERMDEDPVLFKRLSELIEEAIEAYHQDRLNARDYLARIQELQAQAEGRGGEDVPRALHGQPEARAYYNVLTEELSSETAGDGAALAPAPLAQAALQIDTIIDELKIVDWQRNPDVEKQMRGDVEDFLIESGLVDIDEPGGFDTIDRILDQALRIAKSQSER